MKNLQDYLSELLNGERRWRRAVPPAARAAAAEDFEMLTAAETIWSIFFDSNFVKNINFHKNQSEIQ